MAAQAMGSCYHTGPCEGEEDPPVLGGNTCWLCSGSPLGRDDPRRVTGMALCLYCPWVLCPPSVCTSVLVGLSASQAKPC